MFCCLGLVLYLFILKAILESETIDILCSKRFESSFSRKIDSQFFKNTSVNKEKKCASTFAYCLVALQ